MHYTVKSSERLRKAGSDHETKALLYLMNFRSDSKEIYYFIVDFFNDLTGMDRFSEKLWDVQSKAGKNTSPKAIGKELVTLFKNHISELSFNNYILFVGGVSTTLCKDNTLTSFGIENITEKSLSKVIEGLKEEAQNKSYIDNSCITDENIESFFNKLLIVIDDKSNTDYVRSIIKDHPNIIPNENTLQTIFNEIRNKQSEKKNTLVEDITIQSSDEALNYCRHLTYNEIRLVTLHRIINSNPVEKSIPISFVNIYNSWVPERKREMHDECIQSLCRALFNKNNADAFWNLFENVYTIIIKQPAAKVQEIYTQIDSDTKKACVDFDSISLKYFIAVVKDGIQNDY